MSKHDQFLNWLCFLIKCKNRWFWFNYSIRQEQKLYEKHKIHTNVKNLWRNPINMLNCSYHSTCWYVRKDLICSISLHPHLSVLPVIWTAFTCPNSAAEAVFCSATEGNTLLRFLWCHPNSTRHSLPFSIYPLCFYRPVKEGSSYVVSGSPRYWECGHNTLISIVKKYMCWCAGRACPHCFLSCGQNAFSAPENKV